ncbi:hypothetical protein D1003_03135 [Riemerella anatipestifer]|nr:hypothetical protein [Riemerella anatipestifer]
MFQDKRTYTHIYHHLAIINALPSKGKFRSSQKDIHTYLSPFFCLEANLTEWFGGAKRTAPKTYAYKNYFYAYKKKSDAYKF